ncbi:MAG TPA: M48 family metalloprotease [Terriglobia bacterium]|nr:M48 family metalloprotease [Terriglobia bacterium]
MAITSEQFERMVRELEGKASKNPSGYRLKVGLLAALGYVYVFVVLAILLALLALLGYALVNRRGGGAALMKMGLALGLLAFAIIRSLWVRMDPPTGMELTSRDAPRLFADLDLIRSRLAAPGIDHVLLTGDFNASMSQVPRLGVFGWMKGYLSLGLPLMEALTPQQLRGVIAHELGHLSGNHSRFSGWIYRVRKTWEQILQRLTREGRWGTGIFTRFFNWYAPYLAAYSFVLAREQEYEADKRAAEVVGARATGDGLVQLTVRGSAMDRNFWPDVFRSARHNSRPPGDLYSWLGAFAKGAVDADVCSRSLQQGLRMKTGYVDTHPSLRDRLRALGHPLASADSEGFQTGVTKLAAAVDITAAEHYFGGSLPIRRQALAGLWQSMIAGAWRERNREMSEAAQELERLAARANEQPLNEEEAWDRARLTYNLEGGVAAIAFLEDALRVNAGHAAANYVLGETLLELDDPRGVARLEAAMKTDPSCAPQALDLIRQFHEREGREVDADDYHHRLLKQQDLLNLAAEERQSVSVSDGFLPHDLQGESIERLVAQLRRYPRVETAYLARKAVQHLPEKPFHVLGLVLDNRWYKWQSDAKDTELLSQIVQNVSFDGETFIMLLNGSNRRIRRKLKSVQGARIL